MGYVARVMHSMACKACQSCRGMGAIRIFVHRVHKQNVRVPAFRLKGLSEHGKKGRVEGVSPIRPAKALQLKAVGKPAALRKAKQYLVNQGIGRKTAGLKLVLGKDGWLALFLVAQLGHDTGKLFIVPFAICGCVRYCQREHWFKASAKLREKIPCQRTLRLACMGHGG